MQRRKPFCDKKIERKSTLKGQTWNTDVLILSASGRTEYIQKKSRSNGFSAVDNWLDFSDAYLDAREGDEDLSLPVVVSFVRVTEYKVALQTL